MTDLDKAFGNLAQNLMTVVDGLTSDLPAEEQAAQRLRFYLALLATEIEAVVPLQHHEQTVQYVAAELRNCMSLRNGETLQ